MKIIDVLNKIANGENFRFKIDDIVYIVLENELYYSDMEKAEWYIDEEWLNKEVEIIEEDKNIKKIGKSFKTNCLNDDLQRQIETIQYNFALTASKIDEIVDVLNKYECLLEKVGDSNE